MLKKQRFPIYREYAFLFRCITSSESYIAVEHFSLRSEIHSVKKCSKAFMDTLINEGRIISEQEFKEAFYAAQSEIGKEMYMATPAPEKDIRVCPKDEFSTQLETV